MGTEDDLSSKSILSQKVSPAPDTPKVACIEKSISRKRILSSQSSQNPRSPKKKKSFSEESSVEILLRLQKNLKNHDEDKKDPLQQLLKIDLTIDDLLKTGIGKDVRRLKNERGSVGSLAKQIVEKWGILIDQHLLDQKSFVSNADTSVHNMNNDIDDDNEESNDNESHKSLNYSRIDVGQSSSKDSDQFDNIDLEKDNDSKAFDVIQNQELDIAQNSNKDCNYFEDFEFEDMNDFTLDIKENHITGKQSENSIVEKRDDMIKHAKVHDKYDEGLTDSLFTPPPVNKHLLLPLTPHCTPLPDFETYLSPELKAELKRYGLKAVPRKKAILFLQ